MNKILFFQFMPECRSIDASGRIIFPLYVPEFGDSSRKNKKISC